MDKRWKNLGLFAGVIILVLLLAFFVLPNLNQDWREFLNGFNKVDDVDEPVILFSKEVISFDSTKLMDFDNSDLQEVKTSLSLNLSLGSKENKDVSEIYLNYILLLEGRNNLVKDLEKLRVLDYDCDSISYYSEINSGIDKLIVDSNNLGVKIDYYIENYFPNNSIETVTSNNLTHISVFANEMQYLDYADFKKIYLSLSEGCQ